MFTFIFLLSTLQTLQGFSKVFARLCVLQGFSYIVNISGVRASFCAKIGIRTVRAVIDGTALLRRAADVNKEIYK